MGPLSQNQIDFFKREGYLVPRGIIPRRIIEDLQEEITGVIDETALKLQQEGKISDLCRRMDFLHRLTALKQQCPEIMGPIMSGSHAGPAMFNLLRCPDLLDLVEQMVGPEVVASAVYRIRPKVPYDAAHDVPWHQDSAYFHTMGDKHLIMTVWVPLMNATVEAGCMQVVPRSHLNGVVRHYWAKLPAPPLSVHPDHMPDIPPVPVPADVGDIVMLTNLTMHRSTPNSSGLVRWACDLRYNNDQAGDIYPYEAEFLARSRKRPQDVLTDPAEFYRRRREHKPNGTVDRSWLKQDVETFVKQPW